MFNPRLRVEWLLSFLAVVEAGGFSSAAKAAHRSQPRISSHVAELERVVGVALFDRSRRPVELTRAGQAMLRSARSVRRQLELAEADMIGWKCGSRGIVHLGSFPSASASFVVPLLAATARSCPDISVSLVERSTLELDDAALAGEVDLYLRPVLPAPVEPIRMQPLWREDLVAVMPEDHPLAEAHDDLPVDEVAHYPLISIGQLGDDAPPAFETYESFQAAGHPLAPVQATNQPQTLVSMVRAGLGIGVTNRLAVLTADLRGLRLQRISTAHERVVAVCWLDEALLSPATSTLLRFIRAAPIPAGTRHLIDQEQRRDDAAAIDTDADLADVVDIGAPGSSSIPHRTRTPTEAGPTPSQLRHVRSAPSCKNQIKN